MPLFYEIEYLNDRIGTDSLMTVPKTAGVLYPYDMPIVFWTGIQEHLENKAVIIRCTEDDVNTDIYGIQNEATTGFADPSIDVSCQEKLISLSNEQEVHVPFPHAKLNVKPVVVFHLLHRQLFTIHKAEHHQALGDS